VRTWQRIREPFYKRHNHEHAYAAVILSGSYEEAGDHGRFRVQPGDVLIHESFESHLDRVSASGAVVLNLRLTTGHSFRAGMARIGDPDAVVRRAERSGSAAVEFLLSSLMPAPSAQADWPDALAADMIRDPSVSLADWGVAKGITPWAISRGFKQVFGVSPSAFRARARARLAWSAIREGDEHLAQLAVRLGFADQSHMTRGVKAVTGLTPQQWRCK
jgi:AraC-like DNA-binding protein